MRLHRTLIATAVTFATVAGALTSSDAWQPAAAAQTSSTLTPAGSPPASTTATPPNTVADNVTPPAVGSSRADAPVRSVTPDPAVTPAPDVTPVPVGAALLAADLPPAGSDAPIATGAEAVRWLEEAPPRVRGDIAGNVGQSPDELTRLFLGDPTAFLGADGMVGYIDPIPAGDLDAHDHDHGAAGDLHGHDHDDTDHGAVDAEPVDAEPVDAEPDEVSAAAAAALVEALGETPADVFALHSLPSSTKVIYLDFDGHQMEDEYWNGRFGIGPFANDAYDIDGNPAVFSTTERDRIYEIFQRVADDYAPFDIDVTTEDPGIDGLRRTSSGDTTYGVRVVITSSDWFAAANGGARIGGIALLNVFTSSTDHAAYVFSGNLGGGRAKSVADATSHEAGHNLSLRHDGTSTRDYYSGHGSWGPIMGTPYSRSVTQWSDGQYPDANNTTEDDLAEIGARSGFRPDDHADTPADATAVTAGDHAGLVGVGGDVDVFRYTPTGNATRVDVSTPPPGNNLLARLTVRDADGDVVAEVEPSVASGWSLTADVPAGAGAFTVEVAPSSWLTPATGFVTYGSLGHYTISFTDIPGPTTTSSTTTTSTTPRHYIDHDHHEHGPRDNHIDHDHHHDGADDDHYLDHDHDRDHDHDGRAHHDDRAATTTTARPTTTTPTTTTPTTDRPPRHRPPTPTTTTPTTTTPTTTTPTTTTTTAHHRRRSRTDWR